MSQESIVDATRPSPGRIYDYLLGGHHNFEVDRQAVEALLKIMPFASKFAKLQRWTLQDLAGILTKERGHDVIIDFASGLPTADHIHTQVPPGTTIIYSDYDPIIVEYAREILGNTPNVHYYLANASKPEELLSEPEVQNILAGRRKVAFTYWGVSSFLFDDALKHASQSLYDWCEPGSCWAFNAQSSNINDPAVQGAVALYKAMGTILTIRSPEEFLDLLKPWELDSQGWIPLLEWHGFDQSDLGKEEVSSFGPMGGGLGGFFIKS